MSKSYQFDFDELLTCRQIARKSNYAISESYVRDACHRSPDNHPCPHISMGKTRPIIKIFWSTFCEWLREEEKATVAA